MPINIANILASFGLGISVGFQCQSIALGISVFTYALFVLHDLDRLNANVMSFHGSFIHWWDSKEK